MFGAQGSGLEMALRSMGLGAVLDAAKELAESGSVQRIIKFADELGEMNASLARIEAHLGIERPQVIEGVARLSAERTAEPGAGADARHAAGGT